VPKPQPSGVFSTRQKVVFVLGLIPFILLAVAIILVTIGIDPLGDIVIDLRWIPWL
jgi:hypothetical protein